MSDRTYIWAPLQKGCHCHQELRYYRGSDNIEDKEKRSDMVETTTEASHAVLTVVFLLLPPMACISQPKVLVDNYVCVSLSPQTNIRVNKMVTEDRNIQMCAGGGSVAD